MARSSSGFGAEHCSGCTSCDRWLHQSIGFSLQIFFAESEGTQRQSVQQAGVAAVPGPEKVGAEPRADFFGSCFSGTATGFVIRMEVTPPGSDDVGLPCGEIQEAVAKLIFMCGHGTVGKVKSHDPIGGYPEPGKRGSLLPATQQTQFRRVERRALRIGALTIGHGDHGNLDATPAERHYQPACAERFIVGVRSNEQNRLR